MTTIHRYEIVIRRRESSYLTLEGLAERADVHPVLVERFVECGLIEPHSREGAALLFDPAAVPRLRLIKRLREHLGINIPGVAVVLDLLDRIAALQRENERRRSEY